MQLTDHTRPWIAVFIFAVPLFSHAETTNLLRNGGFEEQAATGLHNDAEHWTMHFPDEHGDAWGSAARENWRAYRGSFIGAVRGLWAGRGSNGGFWQDVRAEPGTAYRFSGRFFSDPEWIARTQELKIEFWDEAKKSKLLSESAPIGDSFMEWNAFSVAAVAPSNAYWARVVVNVVNCGACGSLQMDELELTTEEN